MYKNDIQNNWTAQEKGRSSLAFGQKNRRDNLFFGLHLLLGKKIDLRGLNDLFFGLHLLSGEKMDNRGLDDLFFGLHLILGKKLDMCEYDNSQRTCPPFA